MVTGIIKKAAYITLASAAIALAAACDNDKIPTPTNSPVIETVQATNIPLATATPIPTPTLEATVQATATKSPSPTAISTNTPTPTSTSVVPTATPTQVPPTATPTPSPSPTPSPTATPLPDAVQLYATNLGFTQPVISNLVSNLGGSVSLDANAKRYMDFMKNNPSLTEILSNSVLIKDGSVSDRDLDLVTLIPSKYSSTIATALFTMPEKYSLVLEDIGTEEGWKIDAVDSKLYNPNSPIAINFAESKHGPDKAIENLSAIPAAWGQNDLRDYHPYGIMEIPEGTTHEEFKVATAQARLAISKGLSVTNNGRHAVVDYVDPFTGEKLTSPENFEQVLDDLGIFTGHGVDFSKPDLFGQYNKKSAIYREGVQHWTVMALLDENNELVRPLSKNSLQDFNRMNRREIVVAPNSFNQPVYGWNNQSIMHGIFMPDGSFVTEWTYFSKFLDDCAFRQNIDGWKNLSENQKEMWAVNCLAEYATNNFRHRRHSEVANWDNLHRSYFPAYPSNPPAAAIFEVKWIGSPQLVGAFNHALEVFGMSGESFIGQNFGTGARVDLGRIWIDTGSGPNSYKYNGNDMQKGKSGVILRE